VELPSLLAAMDNADKARSCVRRRWVRELRFAYHLRDEAYVRRDEAIRLRDEAKRHQGEAHGNQEVAESLLREATQAREAFEAKLQEYKKRLAAREETARRERRVGEVRLAAREKELAASQRKVELLHTTIRAQERSLQERERGGKDKKDWESRIKDLEWQLGAQVRANRALLEAAGSGGPPTPVGLQHPVRGGGRGVEERAGRNSSGPREQGRRVRSRSRSSGRGHR
jgi:hypothetical protein